MLAFLGPFCICNLRPNGIFYEHLVYFVVNLVYFYRFGMLYREKSGNPAPQLKKKEKISNFDRHGAGKKSLGETRPMIFCDPKVTFFTISSRVARCFFLNQKSQFG
jgi:hypothetical protein